MLALLEEIDGVVSVQVDRGGMLMRLDLVSPEEPDRFVAAVTTRLNELGYATNVLQGTARNDVLKTVERWYDRRSAEELSREEVRILRQDASGGEDPELA